MSGTRAMTRTAKRMDEFEAPASGQSVGTSGATEYHYKNMGNRSTAKALASEQLIEVDLLVDRFLSLAEELDKQAVTGSNAGSSASPSIPPQWQTLLVSDPSFGESNSELTTAAGAMSSSSQVTETRLQNLDSSTYLAQINEDISTLRFALGTQPLTRRDVRADMQQVMSHLIDKLEGTVFAAISSAMRQASVSSGTTHAITEQLQSLVNNRGFSNNNSNAPLRTAPHPFPIASTNASAINLPTDVPSGSNTTQLSAPAPPALQTSPNGFSRDSRSDAVKNSKKRVLHIDGEDFHYEIADLPVVPAIHFSGRLEDLFVQWESSNLLKVRGRIIPMKYWAELYKGATLSPNFESWRARKSEWGSWNFIAKERENFTSNEDFWAKWSDGDGQKHGYQFILDNLQTDRKEDFAREAEEARAFFAKHPQYDSAGTFFTYVKSGKRTMLKAGKRGDRSIALRWREFRATHSVSLEGEEPSTD
ncbi:hypothetical protein SCHPADRAFT_937893 [Schizopora paradoxa]|uniref:Uncharacterized protein n=1 Tax=Schizopora paradoxa TaxID=27342 RepID=A0A0H2RXU8_9AGAM|nr:hypothetical protein SCHPADRAFT_937893 [Schizopora paradoxa]